MPVLAGAESVGAEVRRRRFQMQLAVADEPVKVAVLATDCTVAVGERIDGAVDLEGDFSAVASALVAHCHPPES
jgi:hypothetical protein